jgi:hypothetical protein
MNKIQLYSHSYCNCKDKCGNFCWNKSMNIICRPDTCRALQCENKGIQLSYDHFKIEKFDKKGLGLVAKKFISK